ncbi:agamous-like MADS-box protein AGL80 [Trifolium pratense]|uniref:agamous-like MADS-box protein AGL80 n=1 Tax=Trifolium pratense TaxID=57577 RepID=UPI001E696588|nr:agamous-like MADS-box protein AGL80 [Trifolium pratense]
MARGKVKLSFIVSDEARKATYKKRKNSLLKKVDELSTLCGIEACAIVYGPYEPEPEIWPTTCGVQRVLSKFRTMPEFEKTKKMFNQEAFMKQRLTKAEEQLKRLRKNNKDIEMKNLMSQCIKEGKVVHNNMSMLDLNALNWLIDQNLKDISRRMEAKNLHQKHIIGNQSQVQLQMSYVPPPPPAITSSKEGMSMVLIGDGHVEMIINNDDITQEKLFMDSMINGN